MTCTNPVRENHLESCLQKTAKINKIFVRRDLVFLLYSFTVHYNYMEISGFTLVLSIRIVLSCFHLLIFYFEKFSLESAVCRLQ